MKRIVSKEALNYIEENIVLGMGSGTTVEIFIEEMWKKGFKKLEIVPSSKKTEELLIKKGFRITELDDKCDIYIDGADAVNRDLQMIKGGGGALTREKILAYNSKKRIIIVDETKMRKNFQGLFLPIEILIFSYRATIKRIEDIGLKGKIRGGEKTFITDNGNYIFDLFIDERYPIEDMVMKIKMIPGVIETGFFKDLADLILVGKSDGNVEKISKIS